jgi:putative transferase (TIGR04331 family)
MKIKILNLLNFDRDKNIKILKKKKLKSYKFIGPWCHNNINLYKRDIDSYINLTNWGNFKKKTSDTKFIFKIYKKILKDLRVILNKAHKKNYSNKFWEILLHRWLFTWIVCLYSRWEYVNKIKKKFTIKNLQIIKYNENDFIPNTTQNAHSIYKGNKNQFWSEWIFNEIFKSQFLKNKSIKIKYLKTNYIKNNLYSSSKKLSYKNLVFQKLSKKYFIYQTNMDRWTKINLMKNISYMNLFSFNKNINFSSNKYKIIRAKLFPKNLSKSNNFLTFVKNNLSSGLPKIFLENFYQLGEAYSSLNWPKKPKVILTSYGQYYDEIFKYYCAITKERNNGTKFVIMQHGYGSIFADNNFYGINLDLEICDKFLAWGKYKKNKKFLEGIIPTHYSKSKNTVKENSLLIILYTFNSSLYRPPNGISNGNDINHLTAKLFNIFFKNLKPNYKKKIASKNLNINFYDNLKYSIKSKFPNLNFLSTRKKFLEVVGDYKIVINFFIGTPFLECMAFNIPNILIFEKKIHMNFDKKFNNIIQELKKTNIIFDNSKDAAIFLNENENSLDLWWNSKNVQKIRKKFSNNYCQVSKNPDKVIISSIKKV